MHIQTKKINRVFDYVLNLKNHIAKWLHFLNLKCLGVFSYTAKGPLH